MGARVAICIFEEHIDNLGDLSQLTVGQSLKKVALTSSDPNVVLYLKKTNSSIPEWVEIVNNFSAINKDEAVTASSGAILFLKLDSRIIACCFGSSVGNINRENLVMDFGLAVAYRRIPKTNYKSIETFSLTENVITNNRSAAMPSSKNAFNLDSYLETITELSGKYYRKNKSMLVKGKEFFSVPAPLTLDSIKDLCKEVINDYAIAVNDPLYKQLTAVSKIKTKNLIDFLNDKVCELLNRKSNAIHLLDYHQLDELESYTLTPKGDKFTDLEIQNIYADVKRTQKFTIDYLKSRRITVYDKDDQYIEEWSMYRCLFTQIDLDIGGHILYKGSWYEVQKRYLSDLKSFINSYEVSSSNLSLPAWTGENEGDYNKTAAKKMNAQCWDGIFYKHPDFNYNIEFCDILVPDHVIHVKKLANSSLNSHLLMQTYVSAQLLKTDSNIKRWIRSQSKKTFGKNIFLTSANKFKSTEISYVVVLMAGTSKKNIADSLPFFSLITFNMMIRRITALDFSVKICIV